MGLLLILLPPALFGLLAMGVSWWVTQVSIAWAHKHDLIARPNERSSHTTPTPRIGGIGFVAGVFTAMVPYAIFAEPIQKFQRLLVIDSIDPMVWGGLGLSVALAFALGLWDDRGDPPALAKLAGQFVVALIPPLMGLRLTQLHVPFVGFLELHPLLGGAISFVWIVAVMNAVNFMDGINGLAGWFASILGIALLFCTFNRAGCTELVVLAAVMWGSAEGFLKWNMPKAQTFLGDCGSQPLGALVAGAILLLCTNKLGVTIQTKPGVSVPLFDPFLGAMILVMPFLFDVGFTLIRRTMAGKNILQAHREHLYQRYLIAVGESHARTLDMVLTTLWTSAVIGVIYVRFSMELTPSGGATRDALRAVAWAATALGLFMYWRKVVRAEREAAALKAG